MALSREMARTGPAVVAMPEHATIMSALRSHPDADKRAKADRWASAIHFCLAPYEFEMLNAAIAHGHRAFGVVAVSDQSDGFYFLKHTFPSDESRADVFDAMSSAAQSDTGIDGAVIREKPVPPRSLASAEDVWMDPLESILFVDCTQIKTHQPHDVARNAVDMSCGV